MILFITGESCSGKTWFAQKCLERYHISYISMDHLKMGLIRSKMVHFTALDSNKVIIQQLWPLVEEIAKTCIENNQHLIIEGCYLDFERVSVLMKQYEQVYVLVLTMSPKYIQQHFDDQIKAHRHVIEKRLYDEDRSLQEIISAHEAYALKAQQYHFTQIKISKDFLMEMISASAITDKWMEKEGIFYETT